MLKKINDFSIVGIISNLKDYKLAWYINNRTSLNLYKSVNLYLPDFFSLYFSKNYSNKIALIENKNIYGVLFKDLKKFNYLIKINDIDFFENQIKEQITNFNGIIVSTYIDLSKITKKTIRIISEI